MKSRILACFCVCVLHFAPLLMFGQVPSAPIITGFFPNAQCSGGTVTIVGRNFVNVQAVRFGGTRAASFVVNQSGDSIRAIFGQGSTGLITVQTTTGTTTSATTLTQLGSSGPYIGMRIRDVRPFPIAARDSSVETTLIGDFVRDCANTGGVVILSKQVGDSLLTESFTPLMIPNPRERRFTIPAAFVRTPGNIRCYFDDRTTGAYTTTLTVTVRQPRITSLSPTSTNATGRAFQLVINGEDFWGNMQVTFGGVPITVVSTSATLIIANVPASLNVEGAWAIELAISRTLVIGGSYIIGGALPPPKILSIRGRYAEPSTGEFIAEIYGDNFVTNATVSVYLPLRQFEFTFPIISISAQKIEFRVQSSLTSAFLTSSYITVMHPDGQFAQTFFTVLASSKATNVNLGLYPNPAHETITLETDNPTPRTVTLVLRNTLGQELMRLTKEMPAGRVTTPLEVGRFPAGTYFLEVQSGYEHVVERLVKY